MNSAQFVHVSQFIRHLWFMISLYVFKTRTTKKNKNSNDDSVISFESISSSSSSVSANFFLL